MARGSAGLGDRIGARASRARGPEAWAAALLALAGALALAGCHRGPPAAGQGSGGGATEAAAPSDPCTAKVPALSSVLPSSGNGSEVDLDCFAWQSFVALNWRADPARPGYPDPKASPADFGLPSDSGPKVWETYLEASAVFGSTLKGQWQAKRPAVKPLFRTSKFGDLDLSDIAQAGSGDHWLTNQRGDVTFYEVLMNRDEYEFITTQDFDLRTAAGQLACAQQPGKQIDDGPPPPTGPFRGGMTLPEGQANGWDDTDCKGNVRAFGDGNGAMEIKASWTPLPADHSLDYRYKTALAEIRDPASKTSRKVTVGLVGLHIARKRVARHQWTWATFEQIDNSPDEAPNGGFSAPVLPANPNRRPSPGYTFFNPDCVPARDPTYRCQHNRPPIPCGTSGSVCDPYDKPMQITRVTRVPDAANRVTAWFWSLMPAASVFNYYRLVNVQWPQKPGTPLPAGQRLKLPQGDPMPKGAIGGTGQILANTTLESFQQTKASCFDCHANYAQIADLKLLASGRNGLRKVARLPAGAASPYAADYSFLFVTETKR